MESIKVGDKITCTCGCKLTGAYTVVKIVGSKGFEILCLDNGLEIELVENVRKLTKLELTLK